ncbi:D-aminopeptidase [Hathewaya proteolytica DSM 3090]|uniref:D-aminopeptidase n=1 Tax=Hathewaya proteolytica DSM 3090 TaxID=1121331 RepID=A0A1M6LZK1_9CLOT|nr:P1 family peptidase [Hathewaya proteolytica]SHJ76604.1 D-aminopeptidase [Hathewaya proteolytica DSM 3090]
MKNQKRIRDYGINVGCMKTGKLNSITDVEGVKVGHVTIKNENIMTGVTAILPHEGNIFREKVMASSCVINGFGKTTGLVQLEELGNLETPIILTNTLSVGTCYTGLVKYMLNENEDIGKTTGTVNPIICECNDGFLNDIRSLCVKEEHVAMAIENANTEFEEGNVGAGSGMSCYKLKGGIGTASRKFGDHEDYTMGALVMSNTGHINDFIIDGNKKGKEILERINEDKMPDKGSIIIILATDAPFSERQLKRLCKRATVGLARTGSYIHNGSGDIVIGFTTANRINHYEKNEVVKLTMYNEDKIDEAFRAVGESVEEAILNSMVTSESVVGRDGHERKSLKEFM